MLPDSLARTLHDVSFPDSGGGFGYYPMGSLHNRFVIWRSHGDSIELQEVSVDDSLTNNTATISFSGSAVCSIFSGQHLSHFYQIKGLQPHLIRTAVAGVHQETGDGIFVYGLSTGNLLVACVPLGANEITESFEVHQTTMMQKLWNGIVPFGGKSEQDSVSSSSDMAFVSLNQDNQLLLSVCRDHFLRLWDLKHRNCVIATNLLDYLPDRGRYDQKQTNPQTQYASGINHRISRNPLTSENDSSQIWLIYVFLSPTPSLSSEQDGFDTATSSYWYWVELNLDHIRQRDRCGLRVISVTPVTRPGNCMHSTESIWQDTGVLDFVPVRVLNPVKMDHMEDEDEIINESSENAQMQGEFNQEEDSVIRGVWWIAHQTDSRNESLESKYQVRWSAAPGCRSNRFLTREHSMAAAPGWRPYEPMLNWRRSPPLFQEDLYSTQITSTLQLSETIEIFLDFMFEPGRLSWFAIANALKASYQKDPADFMTMLKTFYTTVVDYHEHALQPVGLFQIPYDPTLLPTVDGTKERLPFAPGLVIVRRWGFSLLRPLISLERSLWSPLLNWSSKTESNALTGTCVQSIVRNALYALRTPTFGVNFLAQALTESIETRLHFAFSVLILLTRAQMSPIIPDCTLENCADATILGSDLITRLDQLIRSLRVIRWLGRTRMPALPDSRRLSEVREHVNMLGFVREPDGDRECELAQLDASIATQFPGSTILEQILSFRSPDVPAFQGFSTTDQNAKHRKPLAQPWSLRCGILLPSLSTELNPSTNFGRGLEPVFRHLILGGRALALLHLNRLLAPSKKNKTSLDHALDGFEMTVIDSVNEDSENWYWNGDYSLINLCVGLAHIWLGRPDLAKEDFIDASVWLSRYVETSTDELENKSGSLVSFYRSTTSMPTLNDLLLCSLFAKSFAPDKLFCSVETGFSPVEAQIRFIMKVLPVLETQDCATQVIDLVEFALNRLATTRISSVENESEHVDDTSTVTPWSRRITAVLTALHAFPECSNEGFLFAPDEVDKTTITGQLYARLADLEAALWTRMFKHQLALGDYTRAFMLIRSNPDSVRRRDCLRQFIVTLCDRGEAAMLVSFHYGAAEDEFLRILEARARATDVLPSTVPQDVSLKNQPSPNSYYEVLYAFHIRRANFRAAAMTMFEYAYRLAEETTCVVSAGGFRAGGALLLYGLQRQAAGLLAAINALYVVPTEHQWLVRPGMEGSDIRTEELLLPDEWAFADIDDVVELSSGSTASNTVAEFCRQADQNREENGASAHSPCAEPTNENGFDEEADYGLEKYPTTLRGNRWTRFSQDKHILQLRDLLNLYILTRARLRLAHTNWEQGILRAGPSDPSETVETLLTVALYDEAVHVAETFRLDFRPIIVAVTLRCATLAQCAQGYARSSLGKFPAIPGLSNLPSALEYECDLVSHALNTLITVSVRKSVDSNLLASITSG
ncbi:hypothetical protein FGIG_07796 [Fasciola gigantica]|uniref:Uncharacterized protein n=1 Tax=Fasciola gigantica TaxID=46835 RepID=A0A504YSZ2_FASGI|nr:hypothetical protein FGIG_07796 [Fasciola gigantica]